MNYPTLHCTWPTKRLQYNCKYTTQFAAHRNYTSTTLQLQLQLHYTTLHPAGEVTTANIATAPKNTTPTSFSSINGFALPSVSHNNQRLLYVSYSETSATALRGTTGILIEKRSTTADKTSVLEPPMDNSCAANIHKTLPNHDANTQTRTHTHTNTGTNTNRDSQWRVVMWSDVVMDSKEWSWAVRKCTWLLVGFLLYLPTSFADAWYLLHLVPCSFVPPWQERHQTTQHDPQEHSDMKTREYFLTAGNIGWNWNNHYLPWILFLHAYGLCICAGTFATSNKASVILMFIIRKNSVSGLDGWNYETNFREKAQTTSLYYLYFPSLEALKWRFCLIRIAATDWFQTLFFPVCSSDSMPSRCVKCISLVVELW